MSANYLVNIVMSPESDPSRPVPQTIVSNFSIHWVEIVFVQRFVRCLATAYNFQDPETEPRSKYLALVRWLSGVRRSFLCTFGSHEAARGKTSPPRTLLFSSLSFPDTRKHTILGRYPHKTLGSPEGHINYDNHKNYLCLPQPPLRNSLAS